MTTDEITGLTASSVHNIAIQLEKNLAMKFTSAIPKFRPTDTIKSGLVAYYEGHPAGSFVQYQLFWYELDGKKSWTVLNEGGEPIGTFGTIDSAIDFIDVQFATLAAAAA